MTSVCIQCGHIKRKPVSRCRACHFKPQTEEEWAKSLILSEDYWIEDEYRGKSREELEVIAQKIARGQPHVFDEAEVQALMVYAQGVLGIPARELLMDAFKWLWAPVLIAVMTLLIVLDVLHPAWFILVAIVLAQQLWKDERHRKK